MNADDWKELKRLQKHEKAVRRVFAGGDFGAARILARQCGFVLVQHSDVHYALRPKGKARKEWLLNIYPGNRRLYYDHGKAKPPYLDVPAEWTLVDVVRAAAKAGSAKRRMIEQTELDTDEYRDFEATVEPVRGTTGKFDVQRYIETGEVGQTGD